MPAGNSSKLAQNASKWNEMPRCNDRTLTLGMGCPLGNNMPFDPVQIGPSSDENPMEKGITS